jgi:uncharacterized protein YlxW (UPF0749 family)
MLIAVIFLSIIIPVLFLSIPLVAVIGYYYTRIKAMELEKKSISDKDLELLRKLHEENQNLRQRVENLEQIITSLDKDLLALRPQNNTQSLQQQIEEILKKLKS